jgi:hypothetical protein
MVFKKLDLWHEVRTWRQIADLPRYKEIGAATNKWFYRWTPTYKTHTHFTPFQLTAFTDSPLFANVGKINDVAF